MSTKFITLGIRETQNNISGGGLIASIEVNSKTSSRPLLVLLPVNQGEEIYRFPKKNPIKKSFFTIESIVFKS